LLLRESIREGKRITKRTIANLSSLSIEQAKAIREVLKGQPMAPVDDLFEIIRSQPHGAVKAIGSAMQRLRLGSLLDRKSSPERDRVLAMIAARVLDPRSKLATARGWEHSTLGEWFGVEGTNEDELYAALDWLLARQGAIEQRLAKRHLRDGGRVLYDLSSSYFEGVCCPLARRGYSRDGKKGKLQVNYGLLTDARGCPVSIRVFAGNTSDPETLLPQVEKLKGDFALHSVILVGDRGMVSQKQINAMRGQEGVQWITALKTGAIRQLVDAGCIQPDLFDERNLFECAHEDFPGERLVVCRNPQLARLRGHKRQELLAATRAELEAVQRMVANGRLKEQGKIGVRVGRVLNTYKMAKHFRWQIEAACFRFEIDEQKVAEEAALDGLYVIRTGLGGELSREEAVRHYKGLSKVESAFRHLKSMDLQIRPIHHYSEKRVRAHLFLCMLAYYVQWHMTEAWRALLFADEESQRLADRDPVAPATRSNSALAKIASTCLPDGSPAHSFRTLLDELAMIVRNTCRRKFTDVQEVFTLDTLPNAKQLDALRLIDTIRL
jgi:hypothetical protein